MTTTLTPRATEEPTRCMRWTRWDRGESVAHRACERGHRQRHWGGNDECV